MNEDNKVSFGLASITIGEGDDAVTFNDLELEAESGEITLVPNYKDVDVSDFGSPKSLSYEGSITMPEYAVEQMEKMNAETHILLDGSVSKLLNEIVEHFEVTEEDKKGARVHHFYGAPIGDYSNVYINDELVATYVPNELPFKYKKFY